MTCLHHLSKTAPLAHSWGEDRAHLATWEVASSQPLSSWLGPSKTLSLANSLPEPGQRGQGLLSHLQPGALRSGWLQMAQTAQNTTKMPKTELPILCVQQHQELPSLNFGPPNSC